MLYENPFRNNSGNRICRPFFSPEIHAMERTYSGFFFAVPQYSGKLPGNTLFFFRRTEIIQRPYRQRGRSFLSDGKKSPFSERQ